MQNNLKRLPRKKKKHYKKNNPLFYQLLYSNKGKQLIKQISELYVPKGIFPLEYITKKH